MTPLDSQNRIAVAADASRDFSNAALLMTLHFFPWYSTMRQAFSGTVKRGIWNSYRFN
jgi:hypothetical protein